MALQPGSGIVGFCLAARREYALNIGLPGSLRFGVGVTEQNQLAQAHGVGFPKVVMVRLLRFQLPDKGAGRVMFVLSVACVLPL